MMAMGLQWHAPPTARAAVGAGLTVGDLVHLGPDGLLESRALRGKGQVELLPGTGKVFVQLLLGLLQQGRLTHLAGQGLQLRHAVRAEGQPADRIVLLLQPEGAQKAVHIPDVQKFPLPFLWVCAILELS